MRKILHDNEQQRKVFPFLRLRVIKAAPNDWEKEGENAEGD